MPELNASKETPGGGAELRAHTSPPGQDAAATVPDLLSEAKNLRDQLYYTAPLGGEVERLANRLGAVLAQIEAELWTWKNARRPLTGQAP